MPQFTQKYTIVCFLNPEDIPIEFSASDWPLHATILDTFKTDWSLEDLLQAIEQAVVNTAPFNITPLERAMLGPHKDVPVKLLQQDVHILDLHSTLLELTEPGSFVFNTPEFVGEGFLPHVTDQLDSQVDVGKTYTFASASLIDMFPGGDPYQRKVIETIQFNRA
jgi:hypothetical protein